MLRRLLAPGRRTCEDLPTRSVFCHAWAPPQQPGQDRTGPEHVPVRGCQGASQIGLDTTGTRTKVSGHRIKLATLSSQRGQESPGVARSRGHVRRRRIRQPLGVSAGHHQMNRASQLASNWQAPTCCPSGLIVKDWQGWGSCAATRVSCVDEAAALDDLTQAIYQLNVFADEVGRSLQNGSVRRMTRPDPTAPAEHRVRRFDRCRSVQDRRPDRRQHHIGRARGSPTCNRDTAVRQRASVTKSERGTPEPTRTLPARRPGRGGHRR